MNRCYFAHKNSGIQSMFSIPQLRISEVTLRGFVGLQGMDAQCANGNINVIGALITCRIYCATSSTFLPIYYIAQIWITQDVVQKETK